MRNELLNFTVFPSVVPANRVSRIKIQSTNSYYRFYDDVKYYVTVCPMECHDIPINDAFTLDGYDYRVFEVRAESGCIEFEYCFAGEQKWTILVRSSSEQFRHLNEVKLGYAKYWDLHELERNQYFFIYSVEEDLYSRRPLKGDLHLHSNYSDGKENPETVAANMRRHGNDFCSVTDHRCYASSLIAVDKFSELKTGFTVFPGEEVHENYDGRIHIVNVGGRQSVNRMIADHYDCFIASVRNEAKKIKVPDEKEALQAAFHKVITDMIRSVGGMSVFAHPYWDAANCYNCPPNVIEAVLKNGFFDAFEVLGGISQDENNLQVSVYNEMRACGVRIPIVGSTDCHKTHNRGIEHAGDAHTLVFSDGDIIKSILDEYSVAIESFADERERLHGRHRLVKYGVFLVDNYFPVHDMLAEASGVIMREYFNGAEYLKPAIELTEKRIREYEDSYFGR